jgi:hypothetical protein
MVVLKAHKAARGQLNGPNMLGIPNDLVEESSSVIPFQFNSVS